LCVGSYSTLPLWFAAPLLLFIDGVSFPLHFSTKAKQIYTSTGHFGGVGGCDDWQQHPRKNIRIRSLRDEWLAPSALDQPTISCTLVLLHSVRRYPGGGAELRNQIKSHTWERHNNHGGSGA
jgi:hypothetical protein